MWATSVFGSEKISAALLTVHCEVMPSVGFSARNSCGALTSFCRTPNIGTQFLCPAVQANSPGEFRRIAQSFCGIAVRHQRDVFEQKRIADLSLPTGRHGAVKITDRHLVKNDSEGVNVRPDGGWLAGEYLGGQVEQRSRVRGGAGNGFGKACPADPKGVQIVGVDDASASEVAQCDLDTIRAAGLDQDIGRLQVLV